MSTAIITETAPTTYVEQRKARVAEITGKHSQQLFGNPDASIREIRTEAIRRRLESIFNQ